MSETLINQNQINQDNWTKPAAWIEMRSGALPNSIYFLVGHSADYSKYNQFSVLAEMANAGTYDVFVDGVKQATTASGTATTLNWQTLALSTGFDVTYPEALKTHIVRVTPSSSGDTFTHIKLNEIANTIQGVLWAHITCNYALSYEGFLGGWSTYAGRLIEAITCAGDTLLGTNFKYMCSYTFGLKEVPVLEGAGSNVNVESCFREAKSIRKVAFKNIQTDTGYSMFYNCGQLEGIETENSCFSFGNYQFNACPKLKNLPPINALDSSGAFSSPLTGNGVMGDMLLDFSQSGGNYNNAFVILGGSATSRFDYVKGLILSPQLVATSATEKTYVDVGYTGMERWALVALFSSLPTVTVNHICKVTATAGAADLTAEDIAIATAKGWTVTR